MVYFNQLDNVDIETIYKTFLSAFNDYTVAVNLPYLQFKHMLKRKGYNPQISVGAFEHNQLVGFVLNGYRNWNGKTTAYDLGTGVIANFRKQGITTNLLQIAKKQFYDAGIEQYLLEVITSNTAAVQLYKKSGFTVQREFQCYELERADHTQGALYTVDHVSKLDWEQVKDFWDFKPSWQNSIESVEALSENFIYSIVCKNNTIVGYGIIDKETGDIPQIAVNKSWRQKGIGSSLIADLLQNTDAHKIKLLNVQCQSDSIKHFLFKIGFKYSVRQYEMLLKL
ncbi:GNAT family N-acetyltransferase [Oscillospiraceae bacterium LTW-04]|nr:GNAT family N-acetyltransferase [Oscillospiraceae bacterium MB24-C1]